jgi:hypothetical protein
MKKLIQILIVCGLVVVIGGTASGGTIDEADGVILMDDIATAIIKENYKKALEISKPILEANHEIYSLFVVNIFEFIDDQELTPKKIIKYFTKLSEKGYLFGTAVLSFLYSVDDPPNYKKAIELKKYLESKIVQKKKSESVKRLLFLQLGEGFLSLYESEGSQWEKKLEEQEKVAAKKAKEKAEKAKFNKIMNEAEKYRDVVKKACEKEEGNLSQCISASSCIVASIIEELKHDDRGKKFIKTVKGSLLSKGDYEKAFDELTKSADKDKLLENQITKTMMSCIFQ